MNSEGADKKILCDIANRAFIVINEWLSRDQILAEELRSDETGSRQIIGEECITVDIATQLREHFSDYVSFTLFTHPEETRMGADWYWRIERGNHTIHARVQAKRIQRRTYGESDAQGYIDVNSSQLQSLLNATKNDVKKITGLEAWLAIYARFDATPPCGQQPCKCSTHSHEGECTNIVPSMWIAKAQEISDSKLHRATLD